MRMSSPPGKTGVFCIALAVMAFVASAQSCSKSSTDDSRVTSGADNGAQPHGHAGGGEETCFICDPAKREAGRLWCKEHSCYEDRCWLCQPQLQDKTRPYCKEHSLYEDECFLCRPKLERPTEGEDSKDSSSKSGKAPRVAPGLFCREHRVAEVECGICQPQRAGALRPGEELKVRLESARSAGKAGFRTVETSATETIATVSAFFEATYNENKLARIPPLASGIVRRVLVDVGSQVKAGDVLVEIHSSEVASAKTAFISAVVNAGLKQIALKREERLANQKISSERELQEAVAAFKLAKLAVSTARQKLLNYGYTESEISRIEENQESSAALLVRAPYEGTLVERKAVVGESVELGDALFTLADLSEMWLALSIPSDRAGLVTRGLMVQATFGADPGLEARGALTWVDTSLDEESRMLRARAVVPNSEGKLKAGMFGRARILLSPGRMAVGVPKGAIQRFENRPYAFVKLEDDLYALRRIVVEDSSEDIVAVASGLRLGEHVVVDGAFSVMSEFLKSRLGAGCVDD